MGEALLQDEEISNMRVQSKRKAPTLDNVKIINVILAMLKTAIEESIGAGQDRKQLVRMLDDPRLRSVAAKLIHRGNQENHGDDIVAFLCYAFLLPGIWLNLRHRTKDFLDEELKCLERSAEQFHGVLSRHSALVAHYLSTLESEPIGNFAAGKTATDQLMRTVSTIRERAAKKEHLIPRELVPTLPTKRGYAHADKVFFVRALSEAAKKAFDVNLHTEVAILANVCLSPENELTRYDVKELLRSRRA